MLVSDGTAGEKLDTADIEQGDISMDYVVEVGAQVANTTETEAMRGADGYTESMFTISRLDDFVPANHPL